MEKDAETGGSRRNAIDFRDQQDELGGRENGRIKRFLSPETRAEAKEQQRKDEQFRSLLDYLLHNDPEYAALYRKVSDRLHEIELAAAEALQQAKERIADMEEKAGTLNGRKVFLSRDGKRAYSEDGREISTEGMSRIIRSEDAPSWEDYQEAKKERDDITRYQDGVLNPIKERMADKENPVPKDEMEGMLEDLTKDVPKTIQLKPDRPDHATNADENLSKHSASGEKYLNAPPIQSHYQTARMDIPDLTVIPTPTSVPKVL